MIHLCQGSLFDCKAEALVNPVNCVGVMGKGLALEFKKRYPSAYFHYKELCRKRLLGVSSIGVFERSEDNPHWIVFFPTKRHWKAPSEENYIGLGLLNLLGVIERFKIKSIAVPALGCGLGGLDWNKVKPLIVSAFELAPEVEVFLYEPKESV